MGEDRRRAVVLLDRPGQAFPMRLGLYLVVIPGGTPFV
jgi:hypothetical protein